MNINTVFTAPPRPDPAPRADAAARSEDADSTNEARDAREARAATRAEFSALMALLAGTGTKVRSDLLKQLPADGATLIDSLLDGTALAAADGENASGGTAALMSTATSQSAADALRYGILKDTTAPSTESDLSVLQAALAKAKGAAADLSHARGGNGDEHAHFNEIVGRILSRRGMTADQLKARGEDRAAEVREALDALLASAGTPAAASLLVTPDNATMVAAAAALAKANAASAADPATPIKDVDALNPQLRSKLTRVIERMKSEYGNDVTVVETARSQERQDMLYEQGRTRPGNIVTWTQSSAHTRGEAVDVIVDGSYNNPEGFARLQRIAREEGLRTLGVRDPGHLELSTADRAVGVAAPSATPVREQDIKPLITTAPAAPAAQAGVARVASVAGVANVARVADGSGFDRRYTARTDAPNAAINALASNASTTNAANANAQGHAFGRNDRDDQGRPMNDGRKLGQVRREAIDSGDAAAFGATPSNALTNASAKVDAPATAAGINSAERVADLQDLRDNAPAGSMSRMTLNIDGPDGAQDRITVDLRGASVGTQINTDAASAERLRMRTAELQDALGRHGLESESVRISGTTRAEGVDGSRLHVSDRDGLRLNAAQQSASGEGAMQQGQRDRASTARDWDRPNASRQSRENSQDSARDNAGQRGQRESFNGGGFGSAYGSAS